MLKPISYLLIFLLLALQFSLWAGSSSFGKQSELQLQVSAQKTENERNQARNKILYAEIADLKNGTEAIEERARHDLGMIRPGEVFYRVVHN